MSLLRAQPRDVLAMLKVELREARAGRWKLSRNADGVDLDLVEMLEETIAEIERLRQIEQRTLEATAKLQTTPKAKKG